VTARFGTLLCTAVSALAIVACGKSYPTGATAQDEREILVTTYTAQWVSQLGLAPVPVTFVPSIRQAFGLEFEACGIVPWERRIVYDTPCMERTADVVVRWMTAHEAAHIYYGDWKGNGGCAVEVRADSKASELTGTPFRSQLQCYPAGSAIPLAPFADAPTGSAVRQ
jgi:hypothetical protein